MKLAGKLKNHEANSTNVVWKYSLDAHDSSASETNYTRGQKIIIAIACIGFFPGIYLLGQLVINWIG